MDKAVCACKVIKLVRQNVHLTSLSFSVQCYICLQWTRDTKPSSCLA